MTTSDNSSFNEHHKRHIRVTFQCIDGMLDDIEAILARASTPSPFRKHTDDSSPVQRKVIHDCATHLRETMRRVLGELDIPLPPPVCGALWAATSSVIFAKIHVEEMSASHLAGYGALSDAAKERLHGICVELQNALGKLNDALSQSSGGDFHARLARLSQTAEEVQLVRELERIITAHGLIELRGALAMLLDRLEDTAFEIGVFGRVSSGKSSLLDYLLETDALPVGVTPVTAIPTRIRFGPKTRARVEFAEGKPREIGLDELADFATEQRNPGNARHVSRIEVELPSPRLRDGIVFVDTPGLGSLAVAGAAETAAYLPRCDLGLVLVDASAGLTSDDLQIVQALYRAGATAMVLLSKADLFSPADRERMLAYVRQQLREQAHVEPDVHVVSVLGTHAAFCDEWWSKSLQPTLSAHRELAIAARKRKVGRLQETVIAALELRLRADDAEPLSRDAGRTLHEAERHFDRERHRTRELSRRIADSADMVISLAAEGLARAWAKSADADVSEIFFAALSRALAEPVAAFTQSYEAARKHFATALAESGGRDAVDELPPAAGLPVLDAASLAPQLTLERPMMLRIFGEAMLAHHLRGEIAAQIDAPLRDFLARHAKSLRDWLDRALAELQTAFTAAADAQRARLVPAQHEGMDRGAIERDIALLQQWPTGIPGATPSAHEPSLSSPGDGIRPPTNRRAVSRLTTPATTNSPS